jgi:CRISPR-associated protein Csm4
LKVFDITIKPVSGFGTPLKGDTIFGHFCWQIAYDQQLIGKSLDDLLANYHTRPFAIFSSAYPKFCVGTKYLYIFKTPDLPPDALFVLPDDKKHKVEKRKEYKAKRWMALMEDQKFESLKNLEFLNDNDLIEKAKVNISQDRRRQMKRVRTTNYISTFSQPHNTISRLTGTTGEGRFAPFAVEQHVYYPETKLAVFVGIDEKVITIDQVRTGLERIGEIGFGKDASSGLGKFLLAKESEVDLAKMGSQSPNACYTLSPCVPGKDVFLEMFYTPFIRFGRHGDVLAKSSNPFKNPVIMADEGGIFKPKSPDVFNKPYIGTAVSDLSKTEPHTVMQGYSLYLPVTVEGL